MAQTTIDWYRIPIERDTLRQLTRKSDLRGWLQAGSFLLIYVVLTALAIFFFEMRLWLLMVVACYVHALFLNMMSMAAAAHELSHGTVFKTKPLNDFFYNLFCFLTWNNPAHFRASHILHHHQFTVYVGLDKEVIQGPVAQKLNWLNILSWLTFDFKWFALFMKVNVLHALGNADADFFAWDPLFPRDDPHRGEMCAWARLVLIAYAVILAAAIVFQQWIVIFLVFSYYFARILANMTGAIQHTGLGSSIPDWRVICHTVKVSPILGYLYWNMNYHTEHHMYAAVPFYNLKKLRTALESNMPRAQESFFSCIRLLYQIKARQRKEPGYLYVPEFPPTAAPPRLK